MCSPSFKKAAILPGMSTFREKPSNANRACPRTTLSLRSQMAPLGSTWLCIIYVRTCYYLPQCDHLLTRGYTEYYSYNVQAMLVMFWAAELCQLTYQIGERRKIRRILRKVHMAGKFVSWILPLFTILCLQIPSMKDSFVAFILVADLPLMISLAIGSGLMIAVLIRYVRTRQKFTQWSPPKFNSTTTSEAGTISTSTQNNTGRRRGLYDRWLMVRFTIAFVILAYVQRAPG